MSMIIKLLALFILSVLGSNLRSDHPVIGGLVLATCLFVAYWQGGVDALSYFYHKYSPFILKGIESYENEAKESGSNGPTQVQEHS